MIEDSQCYSQGLNCLGAETSLSIALQPFFHIKSHDCSCLVSIKLRFILLLPGFSNLLSRHSCQKFNFWSLPSISQAWFLISPELDSWAASLQTWHRMNLFYVADATKIIMLRILATVVYSNLNSTERFL